MTVKKALHPIESLLALRRKQIAFLNNPSEEWNREGDIVKKVATALEKELQKDVDCMAVVRKELLPAQHLIRIICMHPKKAHDIDPCGQKYCTDCNADL